MLRFLVLCEVHIHFLHKLLYNYICMYVSIPIFWLYLFIVLCVMFTIDFAREEQPPADRLFTFKKWTYFAHKVSEEVRLNRRTSSGNPITFTQFPFFFVHLTTLVVLSAPRTLLSFSHLLLFLEPHVFSFLTPSSSATSAFRVSIQPFWAGGFPVYGFWPN